MKLIGHKDKDDPPHWAIAMLNVLSIILKRQEKIMTDMENLKAQVAVNTTVIGSARDLLNGIAARITAAGTDGAALGQLTADLTTQDEALAAAVAANTPAAITPNVAPLAVLQPNITPVVSGPFSP